MSQSSGHAVDQLSAVMTRGVRSLPTAFSKTIICRRYRGSHLGGLGSLFQSNLYSAAVWCSRPHCHRPAIRGAEVKAKPDASSCHCYQWVRSLHQTNPSSRKLCGTNLLPPDAPPPIWRHNKYMHVIRSTKKLEYRYIHYLDPSAQKRLNAGKWKINFLFFSITI